MDLSQGRFCIKTQLIFMWSIYSAIMPKISRNLLAMNGLPMMSQCSLLYENWNSAKWNSVTICFLRPSEDHSLRNRAPTFPLEDRGHRTPDRRLPRHRRSIYALRVAALRLRGRSSQRARPADGSSRGLYSAARQPRPAALVGGIRHD